MSTLTSLKLSRGVPEDNNPSWEVELVHSDGDEYVRDDLAVSGPAVTESGIWLGKNSGFYGSPSVMFSSQNSLFTSGEILTPLSHRPKDIVVPIKIRVEDPEDLHFVRADLLRNIDPLFASQAGECVYITHTSTRGGSKFIPVKLISGQTSTIVLHKEERILQLLLVFKSEWPYWSGTAISRDVVNADIEAGTTFTETIIGDVPVYPTWLINGGLDDLIITNEDTGEFFNFPDDTVFASSNLVTTIRTTPGRQSVVQFNSGDVNVFTEMTYDSKLWAFQPGDNDWKAETTNGNSTSRVKLRMFNQYLDVY